MLLLRSLLLQTMKEFWIRSEDLGLGSDLLAGWHGWAAFWRVRQLGSGRINEYKRTPTFGLFVAVVEMLGHVRIFCNPMDCSPPGSSVHGILQARILEWVAISFPRGSSPRGPLPKDQTWSLESSALTGGFFATEPPGKPLDFLAGIK